MAISQHLPSGSMEMMSIGLRKSIHTELGVHLLLRLSCLALSTLHLLGVLSCLGDSVSKVPVG